MYHIGKEVASLITTSSGNDRFPIGPHSLDEKALYQAVIDSKLCGES